MGVAHPKDPHTGVLLYQTTDLLLTRGRGDDVAYTAWAVKDLGQLDNARAMAKLEIERCYWRNLGVDWYLVVNEGLNGFRALNLDWLFGYEQLMRGNVRPQMDCVLRLLAAVRESHPEPAGTACRHFDKRYRSVAGAHVTALRFLFFARILCGDLEANKLINQPIASFEINHERPLHRSPTVVGHAVA
ncbi:TnsA endonuclease N-terminal domain-containing protein [Paraburkholderia phymatum]|uniref:TnsA endonuclease N-terminal domain-containing protein n=1 Tax=Paraburkholderia phymatum TaxID=148447 RepID=UPI0038991987